MLWLEPHRSRDLVRLQHLKPGRTLRIRYGELDLEGELQHWAKLSNDRIVIGDHARHVDLGRFKSLRQRLLRWRLVSVRGAATARAVPVLPGRTGARHNRRS